MPSKAALAAVPDLQSIRNEPRTASFLDTCAVFWDVFLPTIAKGVIIRRPQVLAMVQRLDLDKRAIRRMQRLQRKYGSEPLWLPLPGRSLALLFGPEDVHRVLNDTPKLFSAATQDKVAALSHFEPKGVLISEGVERDDRRHYNEEILQAHRPVHSLAGTFAEIIDREARQLCRSLQPGSDLTWGKFSDAWFRIVRLVVLGGKAADDQELSKLMATLRRRANWAFLAPKSDVLRGRLISKIQEYIRDADPDSLAGIMEQTHANPSTAPAQQVPQWLFAFDAAGISCFRTLALLASHRNVGRRVRNEVEERQGSGSTHALPLTTAAVLEALRLWPTTPLLLRESKTETVWNSRTLPARTEFVIFTPFFHRNAERQPFADRFTPEFWDGDQRSENLPYLAFSDGPAVCPGRSLVLYLVPEMIASLLRHSRVRLKNSDLLNPDRPIPGTLSPYQLRFELRPKRL
jgi:cytochrome P450